MNKLCLIVTIALIAFNSWADVEMKFLTTDKVQDVDIDIAKIGSGWFAIHKDNNQWFLTKTKVSAVIDQDGLIDIQSQYKNAVGLVKAKNLTEGKLQAASLIKDKHGSSKSFLFNGAKYHLVVVKVKFKYFSPNLQKTFENVRNDVYFSNGKRRTLVYGGAKTHQSCAHPVISWAGDIDGDGRADVIADFSDDSGKNGSTCLYLSSLAKDAQLLGNAGCQFSSG